MSTTLERHEISKVQEVPLDHAPTQDETSEKEPVPTIPALVRPEGLPSIEKETENTLSGTQGHVSNEQQLGHRGGLALPSDTEDCREPPPPPLRGLSFLDRFLVLWILLSMALGIILSNLVPSTGPALQKETFVGVSVPIAVGLLVMMYPILCKVRFETLHLLLRKRTLYIHLLLSLCLNWLLAPILMTALAWAFLPDRQELRDGLIFTGTARCIAMVLIWNQLAGGDADYCAVLVAVNSILQMVLYAPLAVFFVKVVSHDDEGISALSYSLVARSVGVFLGIPLGAAIITRLTLRPLLGEKRYQTHFVRFIGPVSLLGLLYTIIVLFGSQGAHVVDQITSVLRVCAPLLAYFAITFGGTILVCWKLGFGYERSCVQCFTAASNNFELAIAVTVAVYGVGSGQALASAVGPLIEVPVLVGCVYGMVWVRKRARRWR